MNLQALGEQFVQAAREGGVLEPEPRLSEALERLALKAPDDEPGVLGAGLGLDPVEDEQTPVKIGPNGPERRWLVCEGACNPTLRLLDRRIDIYRRLEYGDSRTYSPMADERILADLRQLVHTEHEIRTKSKLGPSTWTCTTCGAVKVF